MRTDKYDDRRVRSLKGDKLKGPKRIVLIVVLLVETIFSQNILSAQPLETLPTMKWEKFFGDKESSYLNKTLALTGNELIVGGENTPLEGGMPQTSGAGTWIWKIDHKGQKISDFQLSDGIKSKRVLIDIEALASEKSGHLLLVGKTETGEIILNRMDANDILVLISGYLRRKFFRKQAF